MILPIAVNGAVVVSGLSGELPGGSSKSTIKVAQNESRFAGAVSNETDKRTTGDRSRFSGAVPENGAGVRPRAPKETDRESGKAEESGITSATVTLRKGDLEVKIEIPDEMNEADGGPSKKEMKGRQDPSSGKSEPGKKGKKKKGLEEMKKETEGEEGENDIKKEIVENEMKRAMDQRDAGKKSREELERIQRQGQEGLERSFDNLKSANEVVDNLAPEFEPRKTNEGALDLGPSDKLGELE